MHIRVLPQHFSAFRCTATQPLCADLATHVTNRMAPTAMGAEPFDQTTWPMLLQQRACELLRIHL